MNTDDTLLWSKTKFINGKRNSTRFRLNSKDTETFISNWENQVFARNDIIDSN